MKNLVYRKPDGHIVVVIPALKCGKTLEEIRKRVEHGDANLADCVFVEEREPSEFPPSREFRNCWRHDGSGVKVDAVLETAERWKRVRAERNKRLADSDGLMTRALELDQNVPAWKQYRKDLRDLPSQSDVKNISWPTRPE